MNMLPALAAVVTTASVLVAQQSIVVPNGYADLEGTSAARTPLGWSSGRVQYLIDGEQLCPSVAVVDTLRLRLDGGNFNVDAPLGKTFQCTIDAYEVPVTPATMSDTWAVNIGAALPQTVYLGQLDVPPALRQWPYPNPFVVDITLMQPLIYLRANGNLLLDITVTGGTGDNWPADGFFFHATEARGEITRIYDEAACTTASGSLTLDVPQVAGNGVVGGALQVGHSVAPAGGASLDFVLHVLSFDNQQIGGAPLPVALGVFGAPNCRWNVDLQATVLVPVAAGGQTWILPASAGLVGLPLFTQAVAFDTSDGDLVPAQQGWQVRIGPAAAAPGPAQMVHRSNYVAQTTGALSPTGYYGLVVEFVGSFQ